MRRKQAYGPSIVGNDQPGADGFPIGHKGTPHSRLKGRGCAVPDSIKILAEQIDDQIEASTERCIAASASVIKSREFIALSRESIPRSRAQIRRINSLIAP
jgi:hypothetical protein